MDQDALEAQARAWMSAAAAGDRMAFQHIYAGYRDVVVRFCTRMLSNPDLGEECAQEAFVDLYKALARYRPDGSFKSYLFTIAANRCRKHLRRKHDYALPEGWDEPDERHSPEDALIGRETRRRLNAALAKLPEKQRMALTLVVQEGLSYDQAATAMGAGLGAVKTWIFRARQSLAAVVEDVQ